MRNRMTVFALLCALAGCGGSNLKDVTNAEVELNPLSYTRSGTITAMVSGASPDGDSCLRLSSDTRATLNGKPLHTVSLGSLEGSGNSHGGYCLSPTFELKGSEAQLAELLTAPTLTLELTDGDTTLTAEVQSLCGPRSLRLMRPEGNTIRAGDLVEVQWEPATDRVVPGNVSVSGGDNGQRRSLDSISWTGWSRFQFVAPRLTTPGPVEIIAKSWDGSATFTPQVSRCEGFARCLFRCPFEVEPQPLRVEWLD